MRDQWLSGPRGAFPRQTGRAATRTNKAAPRPNRSKMMYVRSTLLMIAALSAAFVSTMSAVGPALALSPVAQVSGHLV